MSNCWKGCTLEVKVVVAGKWPTGSEAEFAAEAVFAVETVVVAEVARQSGAEVIVGLLPSPEVAEVEVALAEAAVAVEAAESAVAIEAAESAVAVAVAATVAVGLEHVESGPEATAVAAASLASSTLRFPFAPCGTLLFQLCSGR
jgi:hypothetical protein